MNGDIGKQKSGREAGSEKQRDQKNDQGLGGVLVEVEVRDILDEG